MRRVGRIGWLYALVICGCASSRTSPGSSSGTEILWDTWGIPHLYASSPTELAHAFGWAQMEAHGDLLLRLYGKARGRGAEYWGPDYLDEDRWMWTVGVPQRALAAYQVQPTNIRAYLDAFAGGINAYAKSHPERIGDSLKVVLPVSGSDPLAHANRVGSFFGFSRDQISGETKAWIERGSNAWAIGPKRSASGKTMLLANPHLPWSGLTTWFEAQHSAPGLEVYGATLVGYPMLAIAFTDRLGWTFTVNTQDRVDLYELSLVEGGYRWDGGVRPFQTESQVLKVKHETGVLLDTLPIRRSIHGPVIREKPGKAIALRVAGLENAEWLEQLWEMTRARSLTEFEDALRRMQVSGFNLIYADRDGHIMYHYGGTSPVRPLGDRAFWAGIVPGESSATLWTRLHGYDEMPRVVDPPSGWLQNANDPPWWTTFPPTLSARDFPSYLAPSTMSFRAQRSARMLAEKPSISFEELVASKHSTRMELADRLLEELLAAARANGNEMARRAAGVLGRWDRSADGTSRGAVLFDEWWREVGRRTAPGKSAFLKSWTDTSPRDTPAGLADPATAVAALEAAAKTIESRYGSMDIQWGDVYRLRQDRIDLPSNGAPGNLLGVFRTVWYDSVAEHQFQAAGGDSYVAAIEFGTPIRAMALLAYGNWSQLGSEHRTDQLALFARKALRPVWRTRAEVEAHLESRERF